MTIPQRGSETIELDGGALGKLTFEWHDDRYHHRWSIPQAPVEESANPSTIELESVESGSDANWPSSPPLQQIHSQSFGDGREVIFGVGMAGRGHWSASFTLVPDLKCWIVELACKSPGKPERLQSAYRSDCFPDGAWTIEGETYSLNGEPSIALEAIAPGTTAELVGGDGNLETLNFSPRALSEEMETIQWAFRLRVNG